MPLRPLNMFAPLVMACARGIRLSVAYIVMACARGIRLGVAYIVMACARGIRLGVGYIVMACARGIRLGVGYIRARTYLTVAVAYGTCTMPIWLTTTCPKTLIVTLGDVLESGNAKKLRQSNSFRLR